MVNNLVGWVCDRCCKMAVIKEHQIEAYSRIANRIMSTIIYKALKVSDNRPAEELRCMVEFLNKYQRWRGRNKEPSEHEVGERADEQVSIDTIVNILAKDPDTLALFYNFGQFTQVVNEEIV